MADSELNVSAKELRTRTDAALKSLLQAKTDELHKASFKHALRQLQKTHVIKLLRRDIARIKSVLEEKKSS